MTGEMIELGGNIKLSGFKELEPAMLVVVKKMVGNYAKKMTDHSTSFKELNLHLKPVHKTEKNSKYEIQARLSSDKMYNSEVVDFNLFFAIDKALSKIMNEIKR